jgi:hypothetical protein
MKMIRAEFNYPATTQCVPLSFGKSRASCGVQAAASPWSNTGFQTKSNRREAPALISQLYWQTAAVQQQTEFLENVVFAALGASGLVGVAVSLL